MFWYNSKTICKKAIFLVLTGFVSSFFIPQGNTQAIMAVPQQDWPDHIVISEIQVYGDTAVDDFVELYNPTDQVVDLSTWSIQKTSASGGSLYRKALSGSIPAYGYYLIVRNGAMQTLVDLADVVAASSFSLSNNNTLYLVGNNEDIEGAQDADIIDMVGMGEAENYEGSGTVVNPGQDESIERKSGPTHEEGMGNGYDTDDNTNDFILRVSPEPQNSQSSTEPAEEEQEEEEEESEDEEEEDRSEGDEEEQDGQDEEPEEDEGDQADGIWQTWRVRNIEAIMAERQKEPKQPHF